MKIISVLLICIGLVGCSIPYEQFKTAEEKCKNNGGVKFITSKSIRGEFADITCNNGAKFYNNSIIKN